MSMLRAKLNATFTGTFTLHAAITENIGSPFCPIFLLFFYLISLLSRSQCCHLRYCSISDFFPFPQSLGGNNSSKSAGFVCVYSFSHHLISCWALLRLPRVCASVCTWPIPERRLCRLRNTQSSKGVWGVVWEAVLCACDFLCTFTPSFNYCVGKRSE